jgi:hypothetical protein
MQSRLSEYLLHEQAVSAEVLRAAAARQAVYGGALDTALLELGALDEPALWTALEQATGVPVPEAALFENPDRAVAARFGAEWSRRCRGVPVGERDGTLQVLCSEPIDAAALEAAQAELSLSLEVFVVPEIRLYAARQAVYGEPMPPRLVRLLARVLGAQPVRRWMESAVAPRRAPTPRPPPEPVREPVTVDAGDAVGGAAPAPAAAPVAAPPPAATTTAEAAAPPNNGESAEAMEERLCQVSEDPTTSGRLPALRALRARLERPRVHALVEKLRHDLAGPPEAAVLAADALAELRDPRAVPSLMDALSGPPALAQTAHRALVEIAKQDFGQSRRRWTAWWERHGGESRVDWLFEGLAHKAAEVRFSSSEELRELTGEYFGYHFDLPKRERDEARDRWQSWWRAKGSSPDKQP